MKKLDRDVDIDMKNNWMVNLKFPSNQKDATSVEFVNKRITETQKNFLKLDGTNNMTGNLNLNNNKMLTYKPITKTRNLQLMLILCKMK